jgi:hypothetical protein
VVFPEVSGRVGARLLIDLFELRRQLGLLGGAESFWMPKQTTACLIS